MKFSFTKAFRTGAAVEGPVIDREANVIKGVSLISIGPALGHGVLIDQKSLESVMSCAMTYKSGVKVKFNPNTFNHGDGSIVGTVPTTSLHIDSDRGSLMGDLHVLSSYAGKEYLYQLAEEMGDNFGLSIDFSGDAEEIDGTSYSRCLELYGATIVDVPAANANGLFSAIGDDGKPVTKPAPNKQTTFKMTDEEMKQFTSCMAEANKPLVEGMTKLSERLTALEKKAEDDEDDDEPDTDGMTSEAVAAEMALAGVIESDSAKMKNRKVNRYRKSLTQAPTLGAIQAMIGKEITKAFGSRSGGAPVRSSAGAGAGDNKETASERFQAKVDDFVKVGIKKPSAYAMAVKRFPKEYEEMRKEQQAGVSKK